MIASVAHDRPVHVVHSDTARRFESTKRVALLAKGLCEVLVLVKDEYLVIGLVAQDQVAEMVDGDGRRGRDFIFITKGLQGETVSVILMDPLGAFSTHKDVACAWIDRQTRDLLDQRARRIVAAKGSEVDTIAGEGANLAVASVGHDDFVGSVDSDAPRFVELFRSMSKRSNALDEGPFVVEDLHTVVELVADDDVVVEVDSNALGLVEAAKVLSVRSYRIEEVASVIKHPYSVVSSVADDETVVPIRNDALWMVQNCAQIDLWAEYQGRHLDTI